MHGFSFGTLPSASNIGVPFVSLKEARCKAYFYGLLSVLTICCFPISRVLERQKRKNDMGHMGTGYGK
jgi:hypothetical protein